MSLAQAIKSKRGQGDLWGTPFDLFLEIGCRYFPGEELFDPCPNRNRPIPNTHFNEGDWDGLTGKWPPKEAFFCNPPFSAIAPWVEIGCRHRGAFLVPVRSDQTWFQKYAALARVVLIGGRVKYVNPETGTQGGSPSFASCLLLCGRGPGIEFWTPHCHNRKK